MTEETLIHEENDELCEDSTEELLMRYDNRRRRKMDDIPAFQALLCVLLAVLIFAGNLLYPELAEPVYEKLRRLISDENQIVPNLIDAILEKL